MIVTILPTVAAILKDPMKRTTHILQWYLKHAKQVSPPPLIFPEHKCMLDLIEAALNAQDFGLQQVVTPDQKGKR